MIKPSEQIKTASELYECLRTTAQITDNHDRDLMSSIDSEVPITSHVKQHFTKILDFIYLVNCDFFENKDSQTITIEKGITHAILEKINQSYLDHLRDKFEVYELNPKDSIRFVNCFKLAPLVMDLLRKISLVKGRILFVESKDSNIIKETLLIILNHLFRSRIFETYKLVKSQNLLFTITNQKLAAISEWDMNRQRIRHFLTMFPHFSCHCGASLLILERVYAEYQNIKQLIACNCFDKTQFDSTTT